MYVVKERLLNAMTIDVEEYFHAHRFSKKLSLSDWDYLPARLPDALEPVLQLFSDFNVRGTFFILGWAAKKYPALVRQISELGHEVASHGFNHHNIHYFSSRDFYQDVKETKICLENCIGKSIYGYRAPNFSLNASTQWAWDVLMEAGYHYSSSVNPIRHDHYGWLAGPRHITSISSSFLEIPISTIKKGKWTLPCGGGGYFRLLPYHYFGNAIQWINQVEKQPSVFYFHPWEMDKSCPLSQSSRWVDKCLFRWNQASMRSKICRLLSDFRWGRIQDVLSSFP